MRQISLIKKGNNIFLANTKEVQIENKVVDGELTLQWKKRHGGFQIKATISHEKNKTFENIRYVFQMSQDGKYIFGLRYAHRCINE